VFRRAFQRKGDGLWVLFCLRLCFRLALYHDAISQPNTAAQQNSGDSQQDQGKGKGRGEARGDVILLGIGLGIGVVPDIHDQTITAHEGVHADLGDRGGDLDPSQHGASVEGTVVQCFQRFGQGEGEKGSASAEGRIADGLASLEGDPGQIGTVGKGKFAYRKHAWGDSHLGDDLVGAAGLIRDVADRHPVDLGGDIHDGARGVEAFDRDDAIGDGIKDTVVGLRYRRLRGQGEQGGDEKQQGEKQVFPFHDSVPSEMFCLHFITKFSQSQPLDA